MKISEDMSKVRLMCSDDISCSKSNDITNANERDDTVLMRNDKKDPKSSSAGYQIVWFNVFLVTFLHVFALYFFITFPYIQRFKTLAYGWLMIFFASLGVTAGVHRLWAHRSYKAKTPLKIILMIFYYSAGQYSIYTWVRDHRTHHKFTETDADPHNSRRGFFFSHAGWLMTRRHPEVKRKGAQIDMSDITSDPVLAFSEKYFHQIQTLCFIIIAAIPVYFWNEDWYYAIASQWFMRYAYILNGTWSVNSFAHFFGSRPYNKTIAAVENRMVSLVTSGEGWHNYHHVFPWDYKASEIVHLFDHSTTFINFMAAIGWAYDLKHPSEDLVRKTIARIGNGSPIEVPPPSKEIEATM